MSMKKSIAILTLMLLAGIVFVTGCRTSEESAEDLPEYEIEAALMEAIDPEKDDFLSSLLDMEDYITHEKIEFSLEKEVTLKTFEFHDIDGDGAKEVIGFFQCNHPVHIAGLGRVVTVTLDGDLDTLDQKSFGADEVTYTWEKSGDKEILKFTGYTTNHGLTSQRTETWEFEKGSWEEG